MTEDNTTVYYSIDDEGVFQHEDVISAYTEYVDSFTANEWETIIAEKREICVYSQKFTSCKIADFTSAENILDNVINQAFDQVAEYSDSWIVDVETRDKSQLNIDLKKVLNQWADQHHLQPSFRLCHNSPMRRIYLYPISVMMFEYRDTAA